MPFLDETGLARLVLKIKEKFATKDVATSSKDGLMSVDDKKRLDGINDYTTGINLLRGTRDFKLGSTYEPFGTTVLSYYSDGFANQGGFSFYKDEDGFTVAHLEQNDLSADAYKYIFGSIIHLEPNEIVTFSYEFMVDDVEIWDRKYVGQIQCFESGTSTTAFKIDLYPKIVGVNSVESGKWYKARYLIDPNSDKATDVRVGFYLIRNGSVNFKKASVFKGDITNPIWSASPFDIDYADDMMTTGINIFRGTRDFSVGRTPSIVPNYFVDGWFIPNTTYLTRRVETMGFTSMYSTNPTGVNTVETSMSILETPLKRGDLLTLLLDVLPDEDIGTNFLFNVSEFVGEDTTRSDYFDFGVSSLRNNYGIELIPNEWQTISLTYKIRSAENVTRIRSSFPLGYQRLRGIRKVALYEGAINHPIWSASPFDVAQEDEVLGINDMTTGINLLRGTRSPSSGTGERIDVGGASQYIDTGFYLASSAQNVTFERIKNDFGTIVYNGPATAALSYINAPVVNIGKLKNGESVTISFEIMFGEDFSPAESSSTRIDSSGLFEGTSTVIISSNHTYSDYGVTPNIRNEWQLAKLVFTAPKDIEDCYVKLQLQPRGAGVQKFRKLCINRGNINHPIWSPSPFDKFQDNVSNIYYEFASNYNIWFSEHLSKVFGQSSTGSLKIILPHKTNVNDMIRFKVSIYDYVLNSICDYHINGYVYNPNKNWYAGCVDAVAISNPKYRNASVPIKFGVTEDEYPVVEIGTDTTVWSYLHVVVSEVISNTSEVIKGLDSWRIVIDPEVSVTNVVKTISNPSIIKETATPSETLTYFKTSSTATTLPNEDLLVGEIPDIDDEESNDSLAPLPSEGRPMMPMPNEDTNEEGDE